MMNQELTYWIALASIPKIWTKRKNDIYVECFQHQPQISIIDLFEDAAVWDIVGLSGEEKMLFEQAKAQLSNNSFLVEDLLSQGYDILPITHKEYPQILKDNLKRSAPTVIYVKGNKKLLQMPSVAIVGSRRADPVSLAFTDNIAKKAVMDNKVVVSGFAKGVDRQALDSAVEASGKSIIVLPQGIMTFSSGFKQYFKQISQGDVLVMSTFAPKAPWSVEFAMARNTIIYGMVSEIFVAQSDEKGGTWSGVMDGLRRNRTIYVRVPESGERNANMLLIQKGAMAVDMGGNVGIADPKDEETAERQLGSVEADIMNLLGSVEKVSAKEIIAGLQLDWSGDRMRRHLDKMQQIEKVKLKNRVYYRLRGSRQPDLFDGIE